jgi:carbon monoxide dehydrogenase subunit G
VQRVERSAVVQARPDEVFAFIADLENLPAWQTGVVSARRTSTGPMGEGATALVVRELMGQRIEAPLAVTAYEPPGRLTVESNVSGVRATATLDVRPRDEDAEVTFAMQLRGSGFTALMEPVIARTAAGELEASLERLREHFAATDR